MQSLQFLSDKETLPSQSHTTPVVSVCWTSPNATSQGLILSGDCTGLIKAYDANSALAYRGLPKRHSNAVHCITANAAGTVALSSAIDGTLTLWDLASFVQNPAPSTNDNVAAHTTAGSEEPPLLPLPIQDAESLIIGQMDSLTSSNTSQVKLSEAWKTALHPSAPVFAAAGAGAVISLHSTSSSESTLFGAILAVATLPSTLSKQKDLFGLSLAFNSPGTLIAIGTNTGQVLLYTLSATTCQLNLVSSYADHPSPIRALSFTPDLLLVGSDDRTISMHDIQPILSPNQPLYSTSGLDTVRLASTVASLTAHKGWVLSLAVSPSTPSVFASIAADKCIKFWDLTSPTKASPVWTGSESQQLRAFAVQPAPFQQTPPASTDLGVGHNTMTRFITASQDGKLRWYRSAGLG